MSQVAEEKQVIELPSLSVQIVGEVTSSNLALYKETALSFIDSINTELVTEEHFIEATEAIKSCDEAEKELESVKEKALSKTADIRDLFATIDELKKSMRDKRLSLNKIVEARKVEIRDEFVKNANIKMHDYIWAINETIHPVSIPEIHYNFKLAIKGKSAEKSMKAAIATEFKAAKDKADEYHEHIKKNLEKFDSLAGDHKFLFFDLHLIILHAFDHFELLVTTRINEYKAEEQRKADKKKADDLAAKIEAEKEPAAEVETSEPEPSNNKPDTVKTPVRSFGSSARGCGKTVADQTKDDDDHRAAVDKEIIAAFVKFGVPYKIASMIVGPMAKGHIPKVTINY